MQRLLSRIEKSLVREPGGLEDQLYHIFFFMVPSSTTAARTKHQNQYQEHPRFKAWGKRLSDVENSLMLFPILNSTFPPNVVWAVPTPFCSPPNDYFLTVCTTKRSSERYRKITVLKRGARRSWAGPGEQVVEPAGCNVGWAEPGTCLQPSCALGSFARGWRGAQGHPSLLPPAPPRQCWVLSTGTRSRCDWQSLLAFLAALLGCWALGERHGACRFCALVPPQSLSVKRGKRRL